MKQFSSRVSHKIPRVFLFSQNRIKISSNVLLISPCFCSADVDLTFTKIPSTTEEAMTCTFLISYLFKFRFFFEVSATQLFERTKTLMVNVPEKKRLNLFNTSPVWESRVWTKLTWSKSYIKHIFFWTSNQRFKGNNIKLVFQQSNLWVCHKKFYIIKNLTLKGRCAWKILVACVVLCCVVVLIDLWVCWSVC